MYISPLLIYETVIWPDTRRTRYRDLLTSATQISTLRSASLQLSASLRSIADTCANPDDIALTAETSTQVSDSEDVLTILPVAAHMKLLLDAPEALYGYLGEGEVLKAGWLWLVARVVKESLAGMGEVGEVSDLKRRKELMEGISAIVGQAVGDLVAFQSANRPESDRETAARDGQEGMSGCL